MQTQPKRIEYDVCIVGSGAGGGMAAHALTKAGASVVMLEAGGWWDNTRDSQMLTWPWQTPRRGASTRERPFGEYDACIGGWDIDGEPFTRAEGTRFDWWRARMLGGRTNHWGRISLRFGPDDFRGKTLDGLGDDWPISYDDVKPWYDKVDDLIGIFGSNEGLRNHPDGNFQPAPAPRCREVMVKKASDQLDITCIPSRLSIITKPIHGRMACHYCGQCNRGCSANSNFTSPNVLLFPAQKTGKLTIITNAMAREVTLGDDGRATGVSYIDKVNGVDAHVRAKVVVLAASALETVRIMLNSKSSKHPNGLANSSGTLGKYITDTTGAGVSGFIPRMVDQPRHNCDGVGGLHVYMPWWLDNKKLDFPRGYHIEVWGGMGVPGHGFFGGMHRYPVYAQQQQYDQALTESERAIALDLNNADSYAIRASVLNYAGRPEEALRMMEQAVRLNPGSPHWYLYDLGLAYFQTGRYAEAVATLKEIIRRSPNYFVAYSLLASSYAQQWAFQQSSDSQTLEQALAAAQRASALDDASPWNNATLGTVYLWQKQYDQALVEMERAVTPDSNEALISATLAVVLSHIGKIDEALEAAAQALRLKPTWVDAHLNSVGAAYYLAGKPEEAIAALKQYLTRYPNILGAHLTLAAVYSELGQAAEARAEAAEVMRLNPKFSLEVHKQRMPIKDPAVLERHIAALRKAGLK